MCSTAVHSVLACLHALLFLPLRFLFPPPTHPHTSFFELTTFFWQRQRFYQAIFSSRFPVSGPPAATTTKTENQSGKARRQERFLQLCFAYTLLISVYFRIQKWVNALLLGALFALQPLLLYRLAPPDPDLRVLGSPKALTLLQCSSQSPQILSFFCVRCCILRQCQDTRYLQSVNLEPRYNLKVRRIVGYLDPFSIIFTFFYVPFLLNNSDPQVKRNDNNKRVIPRHFVSSQGHGYSFFPMVQNETYICGPDALKVDSEGLSSLA